jgi:hypothetical protein
MKIKFFAQNADFGKSVDEWHYSTQINEMTRLNALFWPKVSNGLNPLLSE